MAFSVRDSIVGAVVDDIPGGVHGVFLHQGDGALRPPGVIDGCPTCCVLGDAKAPEIAVALAVGLGVNGLGGGRSSQQEKGEKELHCVEAIGWVLGLGAAPSGPQGISRRCARLRCHPGAHPTYRRHRQTDRDYCNRTYQLL